jgi:hypothetical protein
LCKSRNLVINRGNAIPNNQKHVLNNVHIHPNNISESTYDDFDIEQKISHKTLGAMKNITGNKQDHYQYLLKRSDAIAEKVLKAQFNKRQARIAYYSCYVPAMQYSLAATTLTEQQRNKIKIYS